MGNWENRVVSTAWSDSGMKSDPPRKGCRRQRGSEMWGTSRTALGPTWQGSPSTEERCLRPISAGHRLALLPLLWGPSQEAMAPPGSCTSRVLQLLECQRAMPWAGHQRQWRGFPLRNLGAAGTSEEVRVEGPLRGPARSIHGDMHAQEELSHLWGLGFSWCREKLWVREC